MYSLKFSHLLREKLPGETIYQIYIEMRCDGSGYEEFYERLQEEGVNFVRGRAGEITNIPEKPEEERKLIVICEDTLVRRKRRIPVDMVILSPALEPSVDARKLAEFTRVSVDENGFFAEEHEKLGPVTTSTEGVYIAGCSQGPKSIQNTLIQAEAAAGKILSSLIPGKKIEPEVKVAHISEAFCIGCKTCLTVCSYGVITFDPAKKVCVVNEVICQGCGNCAAACPSGAASLKHFTVNQLRQELKEAVV